MRITPHEAVDKICLGSSIQQAIKEIDTQFEVFQRVPQGNEVYAFDERHLHVQVDSLGLVKAITVFRPELVYIRDVQLLND